MKIHILFPFTDGPLGGGNQFMKALRGYLRKVDAYTEDIGAADVVLFNSFHDARQVAGARLRYPQKTFVHRVDGAGSIYTNRPDARDRIVAVLNDACADATVFQSRWSRSCVFSPARKSSHLETIIINAPDPGIFNSLSKRPLMESGKLRLMAASWSPNWEKGFDIYQWLDKYLDFTQVEMTFAGRSPVTFENIRCVAPMESRQLAQLMQQADIFITASRNETCPNVLLEALHSGLPAIALRSGAHEEILKGAGELFSDPYDIPTLIEQVRDHYSTYRGAMVLPTMEVVGREYLEFCASALKAGPQKNVSVLSYAYLGAEIRCSHVLDNIFYHAYRLMPSRKSGSGWGAKV